MCIEFSNFSLSQSRAIAGITMDNHPPTIPDPNLGHRTNPRYPGHDSKGFRNANIPAQAKIVTLGDSQTYGSGVAPQDPWPRQLEALTHRTVYNMAYGGYGPVHHLILIQEALRFNPTIVITAFYSGNDLYDSFQIVYGKNQHPELKSSLPGLQTTILAMEKLDPLGEKLKRSPRECILCLSPRTSQPIQITRVLQSRVFFQTIPGSMAFFAGPTIFFISAHPN
jgi:hypothetical protein